MGLWKNTVSLFSSWLKYLFPHSNFVITPQSYFFLFDLNPIIIFFLDHRAWFHPLQPSIPLFCWRVPNFENVIIVVFKNYFTEPTSLVQLVSISFCGDILSFNVFSTFTIAIVVIRLFSDGLSTKQPHHDDRLLQTSHPQKLTANNLPVHLHTQLQVSAYKSYINQYGHISDTLRDQVAYSFNCDPNQPIQLLRRSRHCFKNNCHCS